MISVTKRNDLTNASVTSIFLPLFAVRGILMEHKKSVGEKIVKCRASFAPPLSQRELVKRLKDAGLDISIAELAEIESGNRSLKQYEVTVLAGVLNTTAFQLHS